MSANEDPKRLGRPSASLHLVADRISSVLRPPISPDPDLAQPEQFRRLPNGIWWNDKADHLLGIPVATPIPQLVLWEKFVDRAAKGCTSAFMTRRHSWRRSSLEIVARRPQVARSSAAT